MGVTNTIKSIIKHPFVAGPLGGGIVVLLAYLDSKYRNIEREKSTYWKLFIASSLVFSIITYCIYIEHTKPDEFLDQCYDKKPPSILPKSKGDFSIEEQPVMRRPSKEYAKEIMNNLPGVEDIKSSIDTKSSSDFIKNQRSSHHSKK